MRVWTLVSFAAGIALAVWLLSAYGFNRIVTLVLMAGWAIPAVAVLHVTQIVASGNAWRMVTQEGGLKFTWRTYHLLRWIREAINNLLPVAQLGGVAAGTRLLARRGMPLSPAIASAIVDTTLEFISQIAFTLMGLALLIPGRPEHNIQNYAMAGVATASAVAAGLVAAQWLGVAKLIEWAADRFGKNWGGGAGASGPRGLHDAIMALYRAPHRIAGGFLFHFAAWLLGSLEIYVSVIALGHPVGIVPCLIIEALGQALKATGFAVPASIGVQEGGFVVACGLFGLPPDVSIAVSLIRRLRDVVLGVPALAAWHWLEGRPHPADVASL